MEQVGINNVQQVQYQPKTAATEPSFQGKKPEMKEDGDKKLLGALAGLGAIALGSIAIYKNKAKIGQLFKKANEKISKKGSKVMPDDFKKANIAFDSNGKMMIKNGKITFADGKVVGTTKNPFIVKSADGKGYIKYIDGIKVESSNGKVIKKFSTNAKGEKVTKVFDIAKDGSQAIKETRIMSADGKHFKKYNGNISQANLFKTIDIDGNKAKNGLTIKTQSDFSGTGKKHIAGTTETITDTYTGAKKKEGIEVKRHIETTTTSADKISTAKNDKTYYESTK